MPEKTEQQLPTDRPADFQFYAQVVATPKSLRLQAEMPMTDTEFASVYKVNRTTLWEWRHTSQFQQLVRDHFNAWARSKSPQVNHALYERAVRYGRAEEVKLWNQMFEGFNEKTESKVEVSGTLTLSSWLQETPSDEPDHEITSGSTDKAN